MDGYIPPPPAYEIVMEANVLESYPMSCGGGVIIDLAHDDAQAMADALVAYLDKPENVARVHENMQVYMSAPNTIAWDEKLNTLRAGPWRLNCRGPMQYSWAQRPIPTVMMQAGLGYDPDKEVWFITKATARAIRR